MEDFPPKSRDHIRHERDILINKCNGGTRAPSELRTICSRRTHFLWYCRKRRVLDHLFPLDGTALPLRFFHYLLGCYAVYLANGHTLTARSIKAETIGKYILAAASLIQMFDKLHRDPRKVDGQTTTCPQIQKVIAEVKRYENVPHRCEPLLSLIHI